MVKRTKYETLRYMVFFFSLLLLPVWKVQTFSASCSQTSSVSLLPTSFIKVRREYSSATAQFCILFIAMWGHVCLFVFNRNYRSPRN